MGLTENVPYVLGYPLLHQQDKRSERPMSYSTRILTALKLAMELHHEQRRKGTEIPYITHLWSVAAIVGEHGGTEDQVIAALLHDAIEDQGDKITLAKIREQFGSRVAEIVEGCTDTDKIPKPPWKERKEEYVAHLKFAPPYVKLVSAADKLHNARAIVTDVRRDGAGIWKRFSASPNDILWYYRGIVTALRHGWTDRSVHIVDELERVVQEMDDLIISGNKLSSVPA